MQAGRLLEVRVRGRVHADQHVARGRSEREGGSIQTRTQLEVGVGVSTGRRRKGMRVLDGAVLPTLLLYSTRVHFSILSRAFHLLPTPSPQLLAGHKGPVSSVVFCPSRALLVSGSWDKTVRLWDVFEQKGNTETLHHNADGKQPLFLKQNTVTSFRPPFPPLPIVATLAFRPDGLELAVATLDGQISFWDVNR